MEIKEFFNTDYLSWKDIALIMSNPDLFSGDLSDWQKVYTQFVSDKNIPDNIDKIKTKLKLEYQKKVF